MSNKAYSRQASDATVVNVLLVPNGDGTYSEQVAVEGVEFTGTVDILVSGPLTDRSGTITLGGTAQNAMAANTSRKYARLKNPVTATENLYFSFTGTASTASDYLPAGYEMVTDSFVPTQALSVYAATTAHAFVAQEG